ncbi:MAG: ATP-binding protein [Magnetococcus sp. YQC-9]
MDFDVPGTLTEGNTVAIGATEGERALRAEVRRLEALLQARQEAAEQTLAQARELRERFVVTASHELRSPLNAIIGMLDLLVATPLNAEQQTCLDVARQAADNLASVVALLIDSARIEAGDVVSRDAPFWLSEAVERWLQPHERGARAKGLELSSRIDSQVPDRLRGDPAFVGRVLAPLLANAIKFTERGAIEMEVMVASQDASRIRLCLAVRDSGIGIDPTLGEQIFESFVQGDGGSTRRYGGMGLGLGVARGLIRVVGGRLWYRSHPGVGSSFFCELPFGRMLTPEAVLAESSGEESPGSDRGSLANGLRELITLIEAEDPSSAKRCALLAVALASTHLRGSLAVVEQAIRQGDYRAAGVGARKLAKVVAVLQS